MTTLALDRLTLRYPSTSAAPAVGADQAPPAVDEVTLEVASGEFMVLVGPSGCGKTTTLRLIAGLLSPTDGDIRVDGVSVVADPPERRGAALVAQEHSLFPFRTVGENVAYGLTIRKVAKRERAERVAEALASVRLVGFEDRWPAELSGGQRQRVALARALVIQPRLLLLDEPLSSLDNDLRVELQGMLGDLHRSSGLTTVMVTHDQREAMALADTVAVMVDGSLRQSGPPETVAAAPADEQVARLFGAVS